MEGWGGIMYSEYTKQQIKQFVTTYGDKIIQYITDQGLFFPAVVAQLTVESKWSTSGLSSRYNNYGGIKKTNSIYSNGSIKLDTIEIKNGQEVPANESFATYSDFDNFMKDYVRVLHLPSYIQAGVYASADPYDQVLAMGKGGYSTRDPKQYLTFAKGRIDACLDLYPWGKIVSTAPAPNASIPTNTFMIGIQSIINSVLKPAA